MTPRVSTSHRPVRRAAFLLTLTLSLNACTADTTPATVPDVKFDSTTMTIKGKPFSIEIADTEEKTARGLMYRSSMPADHGMLFILPAPERVSFWMKNTLIPLDIIYLDPTGHVLEIHKRKPLDETGMAPADPALYVIELNAGTADAIGLKRGDAVSIPEKYLKNAPASPEKKP